jgi:hypothetical protein
MPSPCRARAKPCQKHAKNMPAQQLFRFVSFISKKYTAACESAQSRPGRPPRYCCGTVARLPFSCCHHCHRYHSHYRRHVQWSLGTGLFFDRARDAPQPRRRPQNFAAAPHPKNPANEKIEIDRPTSNPPWRRERVDEVEQIVPIM